MHLQKKQKKSLQRFHDEKEKQIQIQEIPFFPPPLRFLLAFLLVASAIS